MERGRLAVSAPRIAAFDLDAILEPKDEELTWWRRKVLAFLASRPTWFFLEPYVLAWHRVTPEAHSAFWWLVSRGIHVVVIVRRPYSPTFKRCIEELLADAPTSEIRLIPQEGYVKQAYAITRWCDQNLAYRFFTRDHELSRRMSSTLCKNVDFWDEIALLF